MENILNFSILVDNTDGDSLKGEWDYVLGGRHSVRAFNERS